MADQAQQNPELAPLPKPMELTPENLMSELQSLGTTVNCIHWRSEESEPCHRYDVIFDQTRREFPDMKFYVIDVIKYPEMAEELRVDATPTVQINRDMVLLFCEPGIMSFEGMKALLSRARSLDMNRVREDLDTAVQRLKEAQEKEAAGKTP